MIYSSNKVYLIILKCYTFIQNLTGTLNDKSLYRKNNANTHHGVIFDIIKPNDASNIVQHIFIDSHSLSMLEW